MNISPIPAEWLPHYTYTDYEKWEGNWELMYGIPYALSPSPNRKHQLTGRRFMRLMEDSLINQKGVCNCDIYYELDWIVNETTVVRPDVMIVCGKFEEDFLRFPPVLIVEIASKKTHLIDRNVKFNLYQNNGVKYYVLADMQKNSIDVFTLENNRYHELNTTTFQLTASCTIELNFETMRY